MRIVAVEAAFTNWGMLPEEWSSLFGVALIAFIVDGIGRDQPLGAGAVGVVAVGAEHLSFPQGVMRRLEQGCADLFMAPGAELLLGGLRQQFEISTMNPVAIDAGELGCVVLASVPERYIATSVTLQADRVPGSGGAVFGKIHQSANAVSTSASDVVGSWTVATFAPLVRPRGVLVAALAHWNVLITDEFVVVAARTELRAHECSWRSRRGSGGRSGSGGGSWSRRGLGWSGLGRRGLGLTGYC